MPKQALYRHFDQAGRLLYVGISLSPFTRTRQHGIAAPWFEDVARISIEWFETRSQAETAEYQAIKREQPQHNRTFNRREKAQPTVIIAVSADLQRLPDAVYVKPLPAPVPTVIERSRADLTHEQLAFQRQADVRIFMGRGALY